MYKVIGLAIGMRAGTLAEQRAMKPATNAELALTASWSAVLHALAGRAGSGRQGAEPRGAAGGRLRHRTRVPATPIPFVS